MLYLLQDHVAEVGALLVTVTHDPEGSQTEGTKLWTPVSVIGMTSHSPLPPTVRASPGSTGPDESVSYMVAASNEIGAAPADAVGWLSGGGRFRRAAVADS